MKRRRDIDGAAAEAERLADLAFIDTLAARHAAEHAAMRPAPLPASGNRAFDEVFIGDDGSLRYDFEVYGTGMSVREWNKAHPSDTISTSAPR